MDEYIDLSGVLINEAVLDTGKIVTFNYVGDKDATMSLDEAVRLYVGDNTDYKEFIDANMDNPWIRIIVSNNVLDNITTIFTPKFNNQIMGLREEIAQKQKQLEELEAQLTQDKRGLAIRNLSDVTDDEKIKKFDSLFKFALSIIEDAEERGYTNEDDEHYAYEEIMGIIAKDHKAFWEYFNEIAD